MTDATEIGNLYLQLRKAQSRLLKRQNDAKQLVDPLRILAECFDANNDEASIEEVKCDEFWYWCRDRDANIPESRGVKDPAIPFPIEAVSIATDIYNLQKEIANLEERLELSLGCL